MKDNKKYWKGLEQLTNNAEFLKHANKEFPEYLPVAGEGEEPNRRDFLKLMGFGLAAVSLAACEAPIKKAIPYVRKPEEISPSVPNYYASTFVSGNDYCSVVVKTREGRPIKIEGNKLSSVSGGGTSPQAQASVLSLYDQSRLGGPLIDGQDTNWNDLDQAVTRDLAGLGGKVTIVSHSIASPSTLAAIDEFRAKYPNTEHIQYDQMSYSGLISAYGQAFGLYGFPSHDFSAAKTIVSFGADFLGTSWPNSSLANSQFAATRQLWEGKQDMSRLYAFESNLSLTGANADYRQPLKPSQEGLYVANLYNLIASETGARTINVPKVDSEALVSAATDLLRSGRASLVVSGSNDVNVQLIVIAINNLLGSYGRTIDTSKVLNIRKGDDEKFGRFVKELNAGAVSGVIFYNCNPVYDSAFGESIKSGLAKAKFSLSTSGKPDETSEHVKYQAPDHHYLESWNDFEPVTGHYSLAQPTIRNIFNTRQVQQSLLNWAGVGTPYYDFIRANWNADVFPKANTIEYFNFSAFWDKCLQDGVFEVKAATSAAASPSVNVAKAGNAIRSAYSLDNTGLELVLYQNNSVGDGMQANNPWLQEMPDPITKACWDNYLTVSPRQAEEWGLELGEMETQKVTLTVNDKTLELPVLPQPGQAYGTVGLAVGYGRTNAGKVADNVGANAYPLAVFKNGAVRYSITDGVSVSEPRDSYRIAHTQTSQTYMGRETVIQETILKKYQQDPQAGRHFPRIATSEGFKKPHAVSLWHGHEYINHHWGMIVDLNSCTGCGACTIACVAENNVPVVGKEEVLNRREMLWLRIDRYYGSSTSEDDLSGMEKAAENPEVTFQPMLCQQCNNAPCETVCPVAATTHSTEGLNQMTYNRCIGTRYCANNCPYKVRRFNWFKYHDNEKFAVNTSMNNDLGKMVLNPDVTVRARGVMEKCTFCVQRIQYGKLEAKKESRRPRDGEIVTACANACPTEALIFGDMKDPDSTISRKLKLKQKEKMVEAQEPRAYHVLEELRTMPNIWYLTKVRNKDEESETKKVEA